MKTNNLRILAVGLCIAIASSMNAQLKLQKPATKSAQPVKVQTGIEVLRDRHFDILQGKRVGLCTNPTGIDSHIKSTIDILFEAPEVNLVALYGPEHGVRGNIHAGDKVADERDPKTGIMMYSLYGKTMKPTPEMLKDIDVMVYDIQDNGCRSFTYITTMGLLMQACAENGKEFVVLDRPNPLTGNKIEGCYVEDGFFSGISRFAIPYLYGLTPGELAMLLKNEPIKMQNGKAEEDDKMFKTLSTLNLTVVPMKGWTRDMRWEQTGLPWVVASPHVPTGETCYYYPATGIFGEFYYFSIGVGYTLPFKLIGAPWINADDLVAALNALNLKGVVFRPIHYKPYYSVFQGEQCQGIEIYFEDFEAAPVSDIQFYVIQELVRLYPEKRVFELADPKRFNMFDKACGTDWIRNEFGKNYNWEDCREYWHKDDEAFRKLSSKYYLYK